MNGTEQESRTDADTTKPQLFVPKLRKNKRLDNRWGLKYYVAVKEAVFASRASPYMPPEPPLSLSEDISDCQPLYVCKQCRDCFRFLSSLEDHSTRRSWILGYWCQNCFSTDCLHVPSGELACSACQDLDRQKKCYLRAKGLKKGRKMGCIKIFYNQCQFFNHLKVHGTITVDMGDVMLMPVPTDIERDHYAELDGTCEILMEHMFLTRTHIMDWLKAKQVGNKWWKLLHLNSESNENPIAEILRVFREKHFRKAGATKLSLLSASLNVASAVESSNVEVVATGTRKRDASRDTSVIASKAQAITSIDPLEPLEDDDDPCVGADIAFVDCGPTAKTYGPRSNVEGGKKARANDEPDIDGASDSTTAKTICPSPRRVASSSLTSGEQSKVPLTSVVYSVSSNVTSWNNDSAFTPKISVRKFANERSASPFVASLWKNFSREYDQRKQESSRKTCSRQTIDAKSTASPLPIAPKTDRLIEHSPSTATTTKSNPKILTVHSPKNANLSTIIRQLPPDVVNGKKIVFIGQDATERVTVLPKQDALSGQGTIEARAESDQAKMMKTVPLKMATSLMSSIANEHGASSICASAMQQMLADPVGCKVQQVSLDGKIIYQNGRKFIIKHAPRLGSPCSTQTAAATSTSTSPLHGSSLIKSIGAPTKPRSIASSTPVELLPDGIVSPPTPSPSPSEQSSGSSCETQQARPLSIAKQNAEKQATDSSIALGSHDSRSPSVESSCTKVASVGNKRTKVLEYLSIKTDQVTGRCYLATLNVKPIEKGGMTAHWYALAPKYRQQMLDNLLHLNKAQLVKRIDHLKTVNLEYSRMISVTSDSIILGNLAAIKRLEDAMVGGALWNNEEYESDEDDNDDTDVRNASSTREVGREEETTSECPRCNRPRKPKSYIVGLTKMPKDVATHYCSCYNHVCHVCGIFQGNVSRLSAHLNYHAKREPFTCPECFRQFSSFKLLNVHVWTSCFHPLVKRWFGCKICQVEGFLDMESVTRHFVIVHSERKVACRTCHVILSSRAALTEHQKTEHPDASDASSSKAVTLIVCNPGQCVVRPERYRMHMDNHVGIFRMLYYKCPFCLFSAKESERGKERIKPHLFKSHLDRLSELIDLESLLDIMSIKQVKRVKAFRDMNFLTYNNGGNTLVGSPVTEPKEESQTGTMIPKIVSARRDADDPSNEDEVARGVRSVNPNNSGLPKILDVRSIALEDVVPMPGEIERNDISSNLIVKRGETFVDATAASKVTTETVQEAKETDVEMELRESKKLESRDDLAVGTNERAFTAATSRANLLRKSSRDTKMGVTDECKSDAPNVSVVRAATDGQEKQQRQIQSGIADASNVRTNFPKAPLIFEIRSTDSADQSARISSILRSPHPPPPPPPLARIPQHLLDASVIETKKKRKKKTQPRARGSLEQSVQREKRRRKRKRPWRIALNGPISRIEETNAQARDYRCHLCGELISTAWPVVRSHFSTRHSRDYKLSILTPRLLRITTEFIEGGYREAFRSRKRRSDSGAPMPKRRKRWTPRKYVDKTNLSEAGFYVRQESAQDGEGNFKCKKCNVRCGDMAELREHIAANHRIKGRYLICLECGENFVVAPSLQMHLKALHGITDPITYMTQNTAYAPEMMDDGESEARAAIANQCHVCMAVFEDKAAVDKHLRVHGMAFLNRKRIEAQNAIRKRPEKKAKLESPSENDPKDDDRTAETSASFERTRPFDESPIQSNDDGRAIRRDLGQQSTDEASPSLSLI